MVTHKADVARVQVPGSVCLMECVVRRPHALARGVVRTYVGRQDQEHVISPYIALACLHTHTFTFTRARARS